MKINSQCPVKQIHGTTTANGYKLVQVHKSSRVGGKTILLSGTSLHITGRHVNDFWVVFGCFHSGRALTFLRSSLSNFEDVICSILEGASLS